MSRIHLAQYAFMSSFAFRELLTTFSVEKQYSPHVSLVVLRECGRTSLKVDFAGSWWWQEHQNPKGFFLRSLNDVSKGIQLEDWNPVSFLFSIENITIHKLLCPVQKCRKKDALIFFCINLLKIVLQGAEEQLATLLKLLFLLPHIHKKVYFMWTLLATAMVVTTLASIIITPVLKASQCLLQDYVYSRLHHHKYPKSLALVVLNILGEFLPSIFSPIHDKES